jgi:hypothetical protein
MCGENKPNSVTEGTRDSAKFDIFCAVPKQKFSVLLLFRTHYDCLLHPNSIEEFLVLTLEKEDSLSLYYTKLERPHIFILQLGLDLLDGKFPQKWIARGVPSVRHPCTVSSVVHKDAVEILPLPNNLPELAERIRSSAPAATSAMLTNVWSKPEFVVDILDVI